MTFEIFNAIIELYYHKGRCFITDIDIYLHNIDVIAVNKESSIEIIKSNVDGIPIKICPSARRSNLVTNQKMSNLHFHDEIEIITVETGSMFFVFADGSRQEVRAGQTIFVGSRVIHSTFAGETVLSDCMLQFKENVLFSNSEKKSGYEKFLKRFVAIHEKHILVTDDRDVMDDVITVCKEYTEKNEGYGMYIISRICSLLGYLKRCGFLSDSRNIIDENKIERLKPAFEYVDEHYASDITLEKMSKLIGISEYHFCRLCKNAIGSSFIDYLNFVRVSKAEKLLRSTDTSVLDIALDTGFSSLSYFNRVFRKFKNCSPTVYRKASRGNYNQHP